MSDVHVPHGAATTASTEIDGVAADPPSVSQPDIRVIWVHRVGAGLVAAILAVFGVLGLLGGLGFFDTEGTPIVGLTTNGLLSTVSLATGVILVAAAHRGGRTASTTMMVFGVLFLVSAFVNLAALGTRFNILAFQLSNVAFSIGMGLVLLFVGAYGRASQRLPADNPYWLAHHGLAKGDSVERLPSRQPRPHDGLEATADVDMAAAERAVVAGSSTSAQRDGVVRMDRCRTHEDRRTAWMGRGTRGDTAGRA